MASQRIAYLVWALSRAPFANTTCPACGSSRTALSRRKYVVTTLRTCLECSLRFRVPKDNASQDADFYEEHYSQGFTTDLPDDAALTRLLETRFANTEKDFSRYIDVIRAAGVRPGSTIYDFGCSWGYGSWQLRQAGYRVLSYEIAPTRARYATTRLGYTMVHPAANVPEKVDCFFASHVLEHLSTPDRLWNIARDVLGPHGVVVLFVPNGDPLRERIDGKAYHHLWGKVHPVLLTAKALGTMATRAGFNGVAYTSPFALEQIPEGRPGSLEGPELALIARRANGRPT